MRKLTVAATLVLALFAGAGQAQAAHGHHGHGGHGHHGHGHYGHYGHHHHYRPYPVYGSYYRAYDPYCAPPVSIYRPAPVYYGTNFGVSTPRFSFFYGN